MNEEFDFQAKLGSLFEGLAGSDLSVDDLSLPIRVGNALHRGGFDNLQQILAVSSVELMTAIYEGQSVKIKSEHRKEEAFWYLMGELADLDNNPKWSSAYLEWREAHPYPHSLDEIECVTADMSDIFQFDKEGILMKELNQKLSERYKEILGESAITAPFGEDGLSMPFLIRFADEAAVETADLRVMFFGQETREWTDTGTVDDVTERYCNDFKDFTSLPGSGVFWHVLLEMKDKINERLPGTRVSFIWNNIVKADYSPSADYDGSLSSVWMRSKA